MIGDPGDDLGVHRLHEQRSHAADECGSISYDSPAHRFWTEETGITGVVEGVCEWIVGMPERVGGAIDYPVPVAIENRIEVHVPGLPAWA